jgi:hypothetical protein
MAYGRAQSFSEASFRRLHRAISARRPSAVVRESRARVWRALPDFRSPADSRPDSPPNCGGFANLHSNPPPVAAVRVA